MDDVVPFDKYRGMSLAQIKQQAYMKAACIVEEGEDRLMKYYGQVGFRTDKRLMVFESEYVKMINTDF